MERYEIEIVLDQVEWIVRDFYRDTKYKYKIETLVTVVRFAVLGYHSGEIASLLCISCRSVRRYISFVLDAIHHA